jgi:hypothetical protein
MLMINVRRAARKICSPVLGAEPALALRDRGDDGLERGFKNSAAAGVSSLYAFRLLQVSRRSANRAVARDQGLDR